MTEDPQRFEWSSCALARCAEASASIINPVVYAEVSVRFATIEELEDALPRASSSGGISHGKRHFSRGSAS